jgi:type IV pilus assembly protein PilW
MSRTTFVRRVARDRGSHQGGFTLVELMVALAISLGLVAALVTLAVRNSRSTAELEESGRQIENGRYALELLADDISLAGYFGALSPAAAARTTPDPCETLPTAAALGWSVTPFEVPAQVQGFPDSAAAPGCFDDLLDDTGSIVVRRVSTEPVAVTAVNITANNPHLQTPQCPTDPVATPFVFSDNVADFTLRTLDCANLTTASRYVSRAYFVAACDVCAPDDGIPTLKRLDVAGGARTVTPVAEGIEELQFEYGFDTDDDGVPDEYRTAPTTGTGDPTDDWSNVMAVRIWLIARTVQPSPGYVDEKVYSLGLHGDRGPFNDAFKRRVYTTLVRLNNPAGLRQ